MMNNQPSHENLKFGAQDIGVGRTGSAPPTNGVPIQPQTGLVPPFQGDVVRPGNIQHFSAPPYGTPFYPQPSGVYYQNNPYYASYPAPFFPSGPNPPKPEGAPEPAFKLPVPKRTPIKIVNPNSKKEIILPTKPPTKAVSLEDVNKPKLVAIELKDPKTGERKSIDVKRPAIPIAGDAKATSPPTKKSPKKETSGEPSVQGSPTMSTASKPVITVSEKVVVVATTTATSPTRGKSPTKGGIGTQSVDKPVAKMIPKHSSTLSPKPIEAKEVSMKPLEAKNATVKIEGKVEPKVESKAVESKQVVQKIELKMPDAKVRVLESSNEPARISSSDTLKVDEKLEVFESPSAIEPGEIRELDYSTVSPLTIEQMSKIEYPPDLSRPKMVDGKITYNFDFFKAFEKMDLPLPKGLPDLTVMYGPEINKGLSSKGGVDMSRGSSYQGSRRNDRGGNSKFSKGLSRSQQSSRQSTARPPKSLHAPALVRGENAWNPGKKQDLSENEKTIKLARGLQF